LVVAPVTGATRDAVFAYHRANLGEFLLPLVPSTVQEVVEARQMITLERGGEIAGLCYVKPDGKNLDVRRDSARFATTRVLRLPAAGLTRIAHKVERLGGSSIHRGPRTSPRLAEGL
jgi:hypothetical protein